MYENRTSKKSWKISFVKFKVLNILNSVRNIFIILRGNFYVLGDVLLFLYYSENSIKIII